MHRLLTIFLLCLLHHSTQAQILDVPAAFNAISPKPQVIHWRNDHVSVPSGGHLQGIQALSDSQLIITASSGSYSYYLSADRYKLHSIHKISDAPFRHAGGCQVIDQKLFVGIEDNVAKDKSEIVMTSVNGADEHIVAHRSGSYKRSTAGAVGATRIATGQYLIAVGDWDSKAIDFYLSRMGDDTLFDSLTTFHAPEHQAWCSYQTLNLLTDTSGRIYIIGLGLDDLNNRADLFELNIKPSMADLKLISTRNFKCKGAGFRYGSGISISKEQLHMYAISMKVSDHTTVNIFR